MKLCETCGQPHPDDVTTSHHPEDCKCGGGLCGGCIWIRTFAKGISRKDAFLKYLELNAEYAAFQKRNRDGRTQ